MYSTYYIFEVYNIYKNNISSSAVCGPPAGFPASRIPKLAPYQLEATNEYYIDTDTPRIIVDLHYYYYFGCIDKKDHFPTFSIVVQRPKLGQTENNIL